MRKSNLSPIDISQHKTTPPGVSTPSEQQRDLAQTPRDERSDLANTAPEAGSRNPEADAASSSPAPGSTPPSPEAPGAIKPKPLTRDQRTALDLLDRGLSVTEIMDTLGRSRQTFYDWGKANPAFAHGAESARDNRRGVLADGVHDLQLAALSLVGDYIRSDNSPDSIRLRAASLVFRYAHSETLLPRRILATFTAPDGISPASPAPDFPDPVDPPNDDPNPQNPAGPSADQAPFDREEPSDFACPDGDQRSDLANTESDERSHVAHSTQEAGSPEPEPGSTPSPTTESAVTTTATATTTAASPTEKSADPVRSVRFENAQSTSPTPDMHMSAPLRTPSVSAGIAPNPERERRDPAIPPAQAPTAEGTDTNDASPRDEHSNVANLPPDPGNRAPDPGPVPPPPLAKPRETILADAYLNPTFLHKHEPREGFERLLKHHRHAYAPATPEEELLTFRITQKSWLLRRLDTLERVIADSAVTRVQEQYRAKQRAAARAQGGQHTAAANPSSAPDEQRSDLAPSQSEQRSDLANSPPEAGRRKPEAAFVPSPYACIAMMFLEYDDTAEIRFYQRLAQQRKDHEAALERLEAKLHSLQQRREGRADHRDAQAHPSTARTARSGSFFEHVFGGSGHLPPANERPQSEADRAVHTVAA